LVFFPTTREGDQDFDIRAIGHDGEDVLGAEQVNGGQGGLPGLFDFGPVRGDVPASRVVRRWGGNCKKKV
jgi:hypothetical protein